MKRLIEAKKEINFPFFFLFTIRLRSRLKINGYTLSIGILQTFQAPLPLPPHFSFERAGCTNVAQRVELINRICKFP